MSGGFFRGTSADQDTRFSNKQAKLMKSQKFPAELEHLVEMTKVQMDVMKPWIATRVTELIGFEDEVLINFIYGLLDKKMVNGKEVQISLTGFMERNTGKFMKELWSLLLSAQQNASGVPQQFLDAKEEENRIKKAETDRIANEIQKKREIEKKEKEEESIKKTDGHDSFGRKDDDASMELSKHQSRGFSRRLMDEKERNERSPSRGRIRSPRSADDSPSPRHRRSRSPSKSFSNSSERSRSRSISKSPKAKRRSRSGSPARRSISPRRRPSPRRRYVPSSPRRRAPFRYNRSPSPVIRYRKQQQQRYNRSRSPPIRRRRSVSRSRSRSPVRRRSPPPPPYVRRRSPFSSRRRSPSPFIRRRYRRSPSPPVRRRSPSPFRRRSPPLSNRKRYVSPVRRRSPTPSSSPSPSPSPKGRRMSPPHSNAERIRSRVNYSPTRYSSPSEDVNTSLGSPPQRPKVQVSPPRSPLSKSQSPPPPPPRAALSKSPPLPLPPPPPPPRNTSHGRERSRISYEDRVNNQKKDRESYRSPPKARHDDSDASDEALETKYSRDARDRNTRGSPRKISHSPDKRRGSFGKGPRGNISSPERLADVMESRMNVEVIKSGKPSGRIDDRKELAGSHRGREKESHEKVEQSDKSALIDSESEESDTHRGRVKDSNKRKHNRRSGSEDGSSSDSHVEDKKEAKRRKKDEKKLKKEERRRKREDRRRRKEEKRAADNKRRLKSTSPPPSDSEKNDDAHGHGHGHSSSDDDEYVKKRDPRGRDVEDTVTETDQKKLEITLREKALESLRAKKGISR